MSNGKRPFVFNNRNGQALFGTLHQPKPQPDGRPAVVLLSPGIKMRVGPHRLYNRLTQFYNRHGFTVFKFDFHGLGDSGGELEHQFLHQVYNDTESGRFVDDSEDALDWLETTFGFKSFIVGGLCGGAITGLLLAEKDDRVKALFSLALTVTLSSGPAGRSLHAGHRELASLGKGYIRNLTSIKSWARLLTFQTEFKTLLRSLSQLASPNAKQSASDNEIQSHSDSNANPLFPRAFLSVARSGRKLLLIYSTADRTYWDFQEKFAEPFANELEGLPDTFELHLIEKANHVFSFREWEEQIYEITTPWLAANFGAHA